MTDQLITVEQAKAIVSAKCNFCPYEIDLAEKTHQKLVLYGRGHVKAVREKI